jgi:beta-glucanase (GH16 family)
MAGQPVATVTYNVAASGGWGGGPGYAGVSRDFAATLDLSGYQALRFWFKGGNTGADLRIELKAAGPNPGASNRFEYTFTDNFSNWRYFSIPFASFVKRTDWNPGAGLGDSLDLTQVWGYSVLIPGGAAGSFSLDEVSVTGYAPLMADFSGGTAPAGFVGFADSWDGSGSSTTLMLSYPNDSLPTIPALDSQPVVTVTYNVAASGGWGGGPGYAGISHDYASAQDWNNYQGLSFWFKGGNTGAALRVELKTDGAGPGVSNRFEYGFNDDFSDWRYFSIPWSSFSKRTDWNPGAALGDTINFSTIWGYSILIPGGAAGAFSMDNIAAYGGGSGSGGPVVPVAKFNTSSYIANEDDGSATITVVLNTATSVDVSVDYATANGTALAGTDYTATSGTLTFSAGETAKTFTVNISDNSTYEGPKTILLALSNPVDATLGTPNAAVLTIADDDAPDTRLVDDYSGSVGHTLNAFGTAVGFATWGSENGNVQLDNPTVADSDPLALPGQVGDKSVLEVAYNIGAWGGFTHAFEDGSDWVSQDWSRYDGVSFWLYGNNTGGIIQTEVFDNQQLGNGGDSAERWYYRITDDYTGWRFFRIPFSAFQRRTDYQPGGAPNDGLNLTEVSGYAFGFPAKTATAYIADYALYGDLSAHPLNLRVQSAAYAYGAEEGDPITVKVWLNAAPTSPVSVDYNLTPGTALAGINYVDVSGTLTFAAGETSKTVSVETLDDGRIKSTLELTFELSNPSGAALGWKQWAKLGVKNINSPDPSMIDDFENGLPTPANLPTNPNGSVVFDWEQILSTSPIAVPGQFPLNYVLSGDYAGGAAFDRLFGLPRDLSGYDGLRFWYKGSNSGQPVTVKLYDGQPDPGPAGWTLVWSDEFNDPAGVGPNPTYWKHNIGGHGWGNNEWQYYTDSLENSATDGAGNMVITAKPNTDPSLVCDYGPGAGSPPACSYTSARLLTQGKIDFAYGRVEARLQIPQGQGIWPAFWMLGSDFENVGWPNSGEIDIMENIGKPSEWRNLYGTVHGPGYSGGGGVGSGAYDTGVNLHEGFHTYAIEWEPTEIRWYFDGTEYFSVTPADLPAGTEWVFDKPFFLILNVAVGGNWPGFPDGTTTFPQQMLIDYVRVYQGPDNAQRFESTFVDDSSDWKLVTLPYSGFVPSAEQPAGAASNAHPVLTHVRGYGFELPASAGSFKLDDVRGAVDATAPDTAISAHPGASTGATSATFTFNSPDDPTATFECSLDGGAFSACESPKTYTGLSFGPHTFKVRAKDAEGNVDASPASHYWVVIGTFSDVPASHWAASFIERLFSAGITTGCSASPLAYCPDQQANRAQMAIFLLKGMHGSAYVPPAATGSVFSDVPASHWAAAWIEQLAAEGITAGFPDGTFRPSEPVTRAQMAIFLLKAKYGQTYNPPAVGSSTGFTDVPTSHWAAAWIKQLAAEGITAGFPDGTFRPNDAVTRTQMAVFLVKTFDLP